MEELYEVSVKDAIFNEPFSILKLQETFGRTCYVRLPGFFKEDTFNALKEESLNMMAQNGKRKDMIMEETASTSRHITTVSGKKISEQATVIPNVYENQDLRNYLESIALTQLYDTPDMIDRHTVHTMHKPGDIHGGHVDDYAFVLITCLEAPGPGEGGEVEFVPYSTEISELGTDASLIDRLEAGDSYFMRSNKAVHRVLPLLTETKRTVVVLTFADFETRNIQLSYSSNSLYD